MSEKCLHCDEDAQPSNSRRIVVIRASDYPTGSRYWDSEYEWLNGRAFCARHAQDADENGFVKYRPRGKKYRRDWRAQS
jgi:hypothetical protein